jgi:OmpA-OmpF porin, OOP family
MVIFFINMTRLPSPKTDFMNFKTILFLAFLTPTGLFSQGFAYQKYTEVGPWLGFANYSGDVAENRIVIGETKVAFGFAARYHVARHLDLRFHYMGGKITGSDQNSSDLKVRGLSFESPVREIGLVGEYLLREKDRVTSTGTFIGGFTPYLFAGGGLALINPTVSCDEIKNGTANCSSFPEPGQKKKHFTPIGGLGIRFDIAEKFVVNAEIGFRPTFQDDIDGVKVNGNKSKNDWYYFFGGGVSYIFGNPYKIKRAE